MQSLYLNFLSSLNPQRCRRHVVGIEVPNKQQELKGEYINDALWFRAHRVCPEKLPPRIRIGSKTKRGPISVRTCRSRQNVAKPKTANVKGKGLQSVGSKPAFQVCWHPLGSQVRSDNVWTWYQQVWGHQPRLQSTRPKYVVLRITPDFSVQPRQSQ